MPRNKRPRGVIVQKLRVVVCDSQPVNAGGQSRIDGGFGPVLLEGVEGLPDARVGERGAGERVVEILRAVDVIAEEVEESEVVDELRGVIGMEAVEFREDLVTDIAGDGLVIPEFVEP